MKFDLAKLLVTLKRKVKTEINKTHLGRVTKLNDDGTVDVQLLTENLTISHVPIFIPATPSLGLAFDIEVNSIGKVTCIDVDFPTVWSRGQKEVDFKNLHGMNAIFEPGFLVQGQRPQPTANVLQVGNNASLIVSTPTEILLGQNATDNVSLSTPTNAGLTAIRNFINSAVIPAIAAASGTMTGLPTIPPLPPIQNVKANKVKAE